MSKIYRRNCDECNKPYSGSKKFCSLSCAWKGRNLNISGLKIGWELSRKRKGKKSPETSGVNHPLWGKHRSIEVKNKISKTRIATGIASGVKNPNWKNGITHIKYTIHTSVLYQGWRKSVFIRDRYTCQECNDDTGGNLEAHHIKSFALILKENNIKTLNEAIICQELWDINNGKTLCVNCHKKTDNYGRKKQPLVPC